MLLATIGAGFHTGLVRLTLGAQDWRDFAPFPTSLVPALPSSSTQSTAPDSALAATRLLPGTSAEVRGVLKLSNMALRLTGCACCGSEAVVQLTPEGRLG